jgi:hypothetical protein
MASSGLPSVTDGTVVEPMVGVVRPLMVGDRF